MVFIRIKPGLNEELYDLGRIILREIYRGFSYCAKKLDEKLIEIPEDIEKIKEYILSDPILSGIHKECQEKFQCEPPVEFNQSSTADDWREDWK